MHFNAVIELAQGHDPVIWEMHWEVVIERVGDELGGRDRANSENHLQAVIM
jgi:hypothetical protein